MQKTKAAGRNTKSTMKNRSADIDALIGSNLRSIRSQKGLTQENLAERLGLHGVSYFVRWTAWLDIAPEGVDKSTGLKVAPLLFGV